VKSLSILVLLATAALPTGARAAETCTEPAVPQSVPDGATATREEMRAAQEAMKAYNAAVTEFSACVGRTGESPTKANEAVRRLHTLANRFNAELRAFKLKSGG
jgi:hypothetical protein